MVASYDVVLFLKQDSSSRAKDSRLEDSMLEDS